jgi:aldehyde dehydrogenase (NAD+)
MATIPVDTHVSSKTADFISRQHRMLIDGRFVPAASGKTFAVHNPATGDVQAQVPEADAEDVNRAVLAARRAFDEGPWSKTSSSERGKLLWKIADLLEANLEEFAELESLDNGKPLSVARVADVPLAVDMFRYMAGWATKLGGSTLSFGTPGNFHSYTMREPIGVVAQIIPWNFPLLMLAWKWGPALACGNSIVMKLAEQTPLTGMKMAELSLEAGFPEGVINVLNGMGETTGDAMVTHPGIDKIAFTGHVDTAKIICKRAADTLKRCTFELGGKSPNVIFADADLDKAVAGAFHAIYFHGGQCCTAGSRLFVEDKVRKEFVSRLADKAKDRKIGDPLDTATEQGPQVSQEQMDKILHYVDLGQKQGAKLVSGGQRHGKQGFFVEPTIFDDVKDDMSIARDEIFGPVVSILPFKGMDELLKRANDTTYGLAAAVWTKDIDKAHLYAREVKAGTVWVNCYHVVDTTTPFGGFKMSGHGRENGEAAIEHYTELKTVTVNLG